MASKTVQVRIDEKTKKETEAIFRRLGLDMSSAIRLFLNRTAAEQGLPFSMRLKQTGKEEKPEFDPVKFLNEYREKGAEDGV